MENQKIQCHFIPNTHWDREWRYSARRTQFMLGDLLDTLFDILEKNPDYKHFHLDSQTMPVQDYLEVYPEKKEKLKKYIISEMDRLHQSPGPPLLGCDSKSLKVLRLWAMWFVRRTRRLRAFRAIDAQDSQHWTKCVKSTKRA